LEYPKKTLNSKISPALFVEQLGPIALQKNATSFFLSSSLSNIMSELASSSSLPLLHQETKSENAWWSFDKVVIFSFWELQNSPRSHLRQIPKGTVGVKGP
jgi:hypothetical protein